MPSLGSIYIRDVSGHSALIDSSGSLQVNVLGGLTAGAGVSGQSVYVASGFISLNSGMWLASGLVVNISGQNVTTTVNTTTNVSGQQVYLGSGSNFVTLSGAVVSVSGNAIASGVFLASGMQVAGTIGVLSGEVHIMSGIVGVASGIVNVASGIVGVASGTVNVISGNVAVLSGSITINSGQVAVSGLFAGFSGAQTFLSGAGAVSGAIPVIPFVYDFSGKQWAPLVTAISGSTLPSVWVASGVVTASIASGNVSVASGAISVVSGSVTVNSGTITASVSSGAVSITSGAISVVSGEVHVMSGSVALLAGAATIGTVTIGSQPITVSWSAQTVSVASGAWLASGIVTNISGQPVNISGALVQPSLGNPTMTSGFGFSGAIGVILANYDFSGQAWVPLNTISSGAGAGLEVGLQAATKIRIGTSGTAIQSGVPSLSGGVALQSGDLYVITLRNLSGNNEMYVGGSGAYPFSGVGFPLGGGDAVTLSVTNANLVSVFAVTSGQRIGWIGSQY